jgi:beta-1,4-mannooligosaccharide/beta-1,4-mannosyl-N-acetylglucosamine phosphorylase
VFPCGLVHDEASDEVRLYYGAADSSICLATSRLTDLLDALLAAPLDS